MKKKYISPETKVGCAFMCASLMTASYDKDKQAASDAEVFSREGGSFWDDSE